MKAKKLSLIGLISPPAVNAFKLGARINSLPELMMAAGSRRSVTSPKSRGSWPRPASFILGWPARDVFHLINAGLFVYNKPPKPKKAKPKKRYLFVEEVLP